MSKKIRKDLLLPVALIDRLNDCKKELNLNFTSTCILLLNEALNLRKNKF